jgi:outer membrane lipopolysaccharide assembly protein LptE/RlpB
MKNIFLILSILLLTNCGFKTIKSLNVNNYKIKEIKTIGDRRINYKIKNHLILNSTKGNKNLLLINLDTKKVKEIKEKNIKNQITKYAISINSTIKINLIENGENINFNLSISGDYLVGENYSSTLNNEKRLIEVLVDELSKNILNEINLKINDL